MNAFQVKQEHTNSLSAYIISSCKKSCCNRVLVLYLELCVAVVHKLRCQSFLYTSPFVEGQQNMNCLTECNNFTMFTDARM